MILVHVFGRGTPIYLKLDTGSPITVLSYRNTLSMLNINNTELDNIIDNSSNEEIFYTYGGNSYVKVKRCCCSNVYVGGEKIDKFYFFLNMDKGCKSMSLLGMDFILRCTGNLNVCGNLTLSYQKWYRDNIDISNYTFIGSLEYNYSKFKKSGLFLETSLPDIL